MVHVLLVMLATTLHNASINKVHRAALNKLGLWAGFRKLRFGSGYGAVEQVKVVEVFLGPSNTHIPLGA